MLCGETGAAAITRLCPRCGSSDHGRPLPVPPDGALAVSISYAAGLVAVAWSRSGPVGIDVEETGPSVEGIDRQDWTLVEAAYKAGELAAASPLELPAGYVGAIAGDDLSWRLAGPAAPAR